MEKRKKLDSLFLRIRYNHGSVWILAAGFFVLLSCGERRNLNDSKEAVPEGMVFIPGGTFLMGGKSKDAEPDEFPVNEVTVSPFYMDATEVTNFQFNEFVAATGYITTAEKPLDWEVMKKSLPPNIPKPPDSLLQPGSLVFKQSAGPVNLSDHNQWWNWTIGAHWREPQGPGSSVEEFMDHPVVHISYDDALAYAKWANKRLPTEAEWEWASLGGEKDAKYPWGDGAIETAFDKANYWQGIFPYRNSMKDGFLLTAPVKTYPANPYGLFDMAGNVWEWCADKYHAEAYSQLAVSENLLNPKGPDVSYDPTEPYAEKFVLRGGSFLCSDDYCSGYRVSRRMRSTRDSGFGHTGFRCVKETGLEKK